MQEKEHIKKERNKKEKKEKECSDKQKLLENMNELVKQIIEDVQS